MDCIAYDHIIIPPAKRSPTVMAFHNNTDQDSEEPFFLEDFLTDSVVHISKLSDQEFSRRRHRLIRSREILSSIQPSFVVRFPELQWTLDVHNQYMAVIENRGTISLPLPEPVSLKFLSKTDLLAIFSKMHSRAFSRSFRLSKFVNGLMNRNITKFSITIREGNLLPRWGREIPPDELFFGNIQIYFSLTRIHDRTSILPFSFEGTWQIEFGEDLFDRMKHPFKNLSMFIATSGTLNWKKWMTNARLIQFEEDIDEHDWKLIEQIKPREVVFSTGKSKIVRALWNSVENIQGIPYSELEEIIRLWRSGSWNFKATVFLGRYQDSVNVTSVLRSYPSWRIGDKQLTFVLSHDESSYLVVCVEKTRRPAIVHFDAWLGIKRLTDMFPFQERYSPGSPIDYSCYLLDADQTLLPYALCTLLTTYHAVQ